MLGFPDLAGATEPCPRCGARSGDCAWIGGTSRCSADCGACAGSGAARCGHCGEVVPCGAEARRNPHPDAHCAWTDLARLHAPGCRWVAERGGVMHPVAAHLLPIGQPSQV